MRLPPSYDPRRPVDPDDPADADPWVPAGDAPPASLEVDLPDAGDLLGVLYGPTGEVLLELRAERPPIGYRLR